MEAVRLYREDGQQGVTFSSPEVQKALLTVLVAEDAREYRQDPSVDPENPGLKHLIRVVENDGIIPKDDDFEAMLTRKGVMSWDIPNTLRSYFLSIFQGGANMQMTWWETIPSDRKSDFIAYLKKAARIKGLPAPLIEDQERLELLIIPILEKGDGWIPEEMTDMMNLGQRWDMTNHQLADKIHQLWKRMTEQLSADKAGRIVNRSAGTMRAWARKGTIHADINSKGHWCFTREVLIDRFL